MIESNDISLGEWKCTEIEASRSDGNWFQLDIDNEDWRFLPDTPTEFLFYAVPHITGKGESRRRRLLPRIPLPAPDLVFVGRVTLGAVLAVFLLSIGMLMGRYRWDDSSVAVLVVLIAAAGSGAWWTILQHKERRGGDRRAGDKAPVLQSDRMRSVLSVQDVLAAARQDRSATADLRPADTPFPAPERATSEPVGFPPGAPGPVAEESEAPDLDRASTSGATDGHDDRADTAPDGEFDAMAPREIEIIVEPEPEPEPVPESDRASIWGDAYDEDEDEADIAAAGAQPIDAASETPIDIPHQDAASPEPIPSSQEPAPDETDTPEWAPVEDTPQEEPAASLDPSISVAELIDKTADVAEPTRLVEKPADRAKEESPIDLTAIRGIGPALSAALTQLGVTDVRDLAILDTDDLAYLERRLGRFASRNRTRQWVAQAQRIVAEQDTQAV